MAKLSGAANKLLIGVALAASVLFVYSRGTKVGEAVENRAERISPAKTPTENECTDDCSGHEAGYEWADAEGIDDEDDCDAARDHSNSPSFAEGCKAFVNAEADSNDEDEDNADADDQS